MSRPLQIMRIAGLLACLFAGTMSIGELRANHTTDRAFGCLVEIMGVRLGWSVDVISVVEALAILSFAACFWKVCSERHVQWPGDTKAYLAAEGFLAVVVAPELLMLVSFQAGMVLQARTGLLWVALQTALQAGAFYLQVVLTGDNPVLRLIGLSPNEMGRAMLMVTGASLIWHFVAYSLGLLAASERRKARELLRVNAELRASRHLENDAARLAERLQLSRELHDSSGHHLAALSVNLRLMRHIEAPAERQERLEESLLIVQQLLHNVREVVRDLREMRSFDLGAALRSLTDGLPGIEVHWTLDEGALQPPPFQAHAMFRCCQEIVTNTLKHSRAQNLWIEISSVRTGHTIQARDDGQGTREIRWGNGLTGMQERVSAMGGVMQVESRPGQGFQVELELPVREPAL